MSVKLDWRNTNSFKGKDKNAFNAKANENRKLLDKTHKVLEHEDFTESRFENTTSEIIKVNQIEKVYKDGLQAVNKTTFSVEKGSIFGLLGPNGAGKTSLLSMIDLDQQRSGGNVKLLNTDIDSKKLPLVGPQMGMVAQNDSIMEELTVDESL